mmetsp:Transcript_28622/g.71836  ORF Transcript_28622/g.71836 Transcript_28622/m.71836 type:complete len:402 (-) Transcript_28622:60-1265(-)
MHPPALQLDHTQEPLLLLLPVPLLSPEHHPFPLPAALAPVRQRPPRSLLLRFLHFPLPVLRPALLVLPPLRRRKRRRRLLALRLRLRRRFAAGDRGVAAFEAERLDGGHCGVVAVGGGVVRVVVGVGVEEVVVVVRVGVVVGVFSGEERGEELAVGGGGVGDGLEEGGGAEGGREDLPLPLLLQLRVHPRHRDQHRLLRVLRVLGHLPPKRPRDRVPVRELHVRLHDGDEKLLAEPRLADHGVAHDAEHLGEVVGKDILRGLLPDLHPQIRDLVRLQHEVHVVVVVLVKHRLVLALPQLPRHLLRDPRAEHLVLDVLHFLEILFKSLVPLEEELEVVVGERGAAGGHAVEGLVHLGELVAEGVVGDQPQVEDPCRARGLGVHEGAVGEHGGLGLVDGHGGR